MAEVMRNSGAAVVARKKPWSRPVAKVANIKEVTMGATGALGDGDGGITKRS